MALQAFKVNFSTYTNQVKLAWYNHTNIAAQVGFINLPFPNVAGQAISVPNLVPGTYKFVFTEIISGGAASLIDSIDIVVKEEATVIEYYHYTVDGPGGTDGTNTWTDPVGGLSSFSGDPRLKGQSNLEISSRGTDVRSHDEYNILTTGNGGWSMNYGEQFQSGDKWTVRVIRKEAVSGTAPAAVAYEDVHPVTASGQFDNTYMGKNNVAVFAAGALTTTFDFFGLIADGTAKFSTESMAARYWVLQFTTGSTVQFMGNAVNRIVLRRCQSIRLTFKAGVCYATDFTGTSEVPGEYLLANQQLVNTEFAYGQEANIADYQYTIDELPAELICSYTDWNKTVQVDTGSTNTVSYYANRGKFAVDTVSGKFRFPDLNGQSFKALTRNGSGLVNDAGRLSQGAGSAEAGVVGEHRHLIPAWPDNPAAAFEVVQIQTRGMEDFTQAVTKNTMHATSKVGGPKNTVDNIGQYALVRI